MTTILAVRKNNKTVISGDGQVTMGGIIFKTSANKIRELSDGKIVAGFAGSIADALTLFDRFKIRLNKYPGQLARSCVELAQDWRSDKYLRNLDSMMIVASATELFLLSGSGEVLKPEDGIMAIGSGGSFAASAARALIDIDDYDAEIISKKAMKIASDTCVYTSHIIETKILINTE